MKEKRSKKRKAQASRAAPRSRRQVNKELREEFDRFNLRDHTGKPIRQIIGEVGEIVGQVVRRKIERAEKENPPPKKERRVRKKK